MSESGSSPMDVAVEMEVDLQEDVGAEFEDLILYSRLGLVDDATELVEEVLLRQIQHFPVFAEVTAFLSERADMGRLEMVSDILASADAAFEDRDEALYCRIISLQRQGRLADQCQMALDGSEQSSLLWDLFNNTAYTSAVQILSLETSLQSLVPSSAASSQGTDPLILFIKRHFQTLITLRCHWEAARIFAILCHIYPVQSTDNADPKFISSMYQSIGEVVQDADLLSRLSADPDATMSTALTALSAKISFMLYIVRVYEQDVAVLVRFVMEGLPPLRMLFTQAGQLLTLLAKQQGESERRSIYFNICHACMQNWKYSVAAAETIRKLNAHIQSFNEKLPPFAITGVKHSKPLPEMLPHPVTTWIRNPPSVA